MGLDNWNLKFGIFKTAPHFLLEISVGGVFIPIIFDDFLNAFRAAVSAFKAAFDVFEMFVDLVF